MSKSSTILLVFLVAVFTICSQEKSTKQLHAQSLREQVQTAISESTEELSDISDALVSTWDHNITNGALASQQDSTNDTASTDSVPGGDDNKSEEEELLEAKLREARRKSYLKYSVPIEKPYLDESVPFQNFSHIQFFAMAGLGHRLVRHAAAVYVGRRIGFAVRAYWSATVYGNGTKDLFSEMFEPYTREEFDYVNSTNKIVTFTNEVLFMKQMAQTRDTRGLESPKCDCTNDEAQVHYDFYMSLRNKYKRRQRLMDFMEQNDYANHTVFGMHIRAGNNEKGDFTRKRRGIHTDPKKFVAGLVRTLRDQFPIESLPRPPMIFLATDDPNYRTLVMDEIKKQGLSWPVVVLEQAFASSGVVLRARKEGDLDMWHSMFQDMLLLSYSDVVIAAAYSSFPQSLPLSLVLGRPDEERAVKDTYCEVVTNWGDNETEPELEMDCYDYLMKWCCGTSKRQHKKTMKFVNQQLRNAPLPVEIRPFRKDTSLSFETGLLS
eukprot:scaffold2047_cov129-Cylindrotheca_fusiformis.AAC.7